MFRNILSGKRTVDGDPAEMKKPERLFYSNPMIVLDMLYVIYSRINKQDHFLTVIDEFIGGRYGKFNTNIQYEALARALILYRHVPTIKNVFFNKLLELIKKTNGKGYELSTKTKNIINCEMGYHYLTYYNKKKLAIEAYSRVANNYIDALDVVGFTQMDYKIKRIVDIIDGKIDPPEHCFTIDDIINPPLSDMYEVLRVGFVIHATEKGTKSWFRWGNKSRFKELFVIIVEMYSQLKQPLCGSSSIIDAVNECILTYTTDPPLLRFLDVRLEVIESKYCVEFDRETLKFRWYIN